MTFNIVDLLNIVFQGAGVNPSDQKIILPQLKNPIQYRNIFFFLLLDKSSLLEVCVSDALIDEIQQFILAVKLPVIIVGQMGHIAIGTIDSLHDFSFYIFSREEAMLREEYIVTMHQVIEIVGDNRQPIIVNEYALPILFEGFDATHIHGVLIVAEVESATVGRAGSLRDVVLGWRASLLAARFLGQGTIHVLIIKSITPQ